MRWTVVGEETPAVHTGFGICTLDGRGSIAPHVHSFEESFYVIEREVDVTTSEGTFRLLPGDYGLVPVGVPHSWRGGGTTARWAEMNAPQPRSRHGYDTFFVGSSTLADSKFPSSLAGEGQGGGCKIDVRDPRTRSFGHIEPSNMDVTQQTQDKLAVSASMRTALLVYSGITVKMMVDSDLGAQLSTMFMVEYQPGGIAQPHDHPLEETYYILEGEVEAMADDEVFTLGEGDVFWTGVGCVHAFENKSRGRVRWLETQSPQPPANHSYRFNRDWEYLAGRLSG
jgi:quercetin dioxygenase-like cupin family protein